LEVKAPISDLQEEASRISWNAGAIQSCMPLGRVDIHWIWLMTMDVITLALYASLEDLVDIRSEVKPDTEVAAGTAGEVGLRADIALVKQAEEQTGRGAEELRVFDLGRAGWPLNDWPYTWPGA
jgi:hypothetical protein